MKLKKNKVPVIWVAILLLIAGAADLKYKGLFYKLLPHSLQTYADDLFHS